jgi:hypothetical protein
VFGQFPNSNPENSSTDSFDYHIICDFRMNPRFMIGVLVLLLSQTRHFSVSPLVVDDADTTESGHFQLNPDFQVARIGSHSLYSVPINPVVGVSACAEVGVTFGYQWRDGSGSTPTTANAEGVSDLVIAPKWRLWRGLDDKLKFSARLDLKLPTASEKRGLGSGDPDAGLVGIRYIPTRRKKLRLECRLLRHRRLACTFSR